MKTNAKTQVIAVALLAGVAGAANAGIKITEYMYQGVGGAGEFIELTNLSGSPIDLTGWFFLDNLAVGDAQPGDAFDLSAFGFVAPGESIIISEDAAVDFAANWNLDASVRVLGGLGDLSGRNLGRNDQVTIYDADANIVDLLSYGDEDYAGSIRTRYASGNPLDGAVGANDAYGWALSFEGDAFGSYFSVTGDLGNPGSFIPGPGSLALVGLSGLVAVRRRRMA